MKKKQCCFASTTKKEKKMSGVLLFPLTLGTATPNHLALIRAAVNSSCGQFGLLYRLEVNRTLVVTNSDQAVVAFGFPTTYNYMRAWQVQDWSPIFLWVHPQARRKGLGTALYRVFERLVVAHGQSVIDIEVHNDTQAFWHAQGFVDSEMADFNNACIREQVLSPPEHPPRPRNDERFYKVMVIARGSDREELSELADLHREQLCKPISDIHSGLAMHAHLPVAAFAVLFTLNTLSVGVLEYAEVDEGCLEFRHTVCLPLPNDSFTDRLCMLAVFVVPTSQTDLTLLAAPALIHLKLIDSDGWKDMARGVLFLHRIMISLRSNYFTNSDYRGACGVRLNDPWSFGYRGIHNLTKPAVISPIAARFPAGIAELVAHYAAQHVPYSKSEPNTLPWSTDFQLW